MKSLKNKTNISLTKRKVHLFILSLTLTLIFVSSSMILPVENLHVNAQVLIKCINEGDFLYFAVCEYPASEYIGSTYI